MKHTRFKIAGLVGGAVLMTLLIILILLQVISARQAESKATAALEALYSDGPITYDVQYSPSLIELPDGLNSKTDGFMEYTTLERHLIEWCREHESSEVRKVKLDDRTLYVRMGEVNGASFVTTLITEFAGEDDISFITELFPFLIQNTNTYVISYVDITGELATIRSICYYFMIAAGILSILGTFAGYLLGRKLEQSSKSEKQFFENTSHELKTPLTAIRGYAEGIETGVITDYKRTGQVISRETEKMSRLIEEILLSAKLESGSMPLHRESVALNELVEECLMPMEGAVASRGLQVDLSLSPMTISADPDRLEHAFANLLTNAVKYAKSRLSIQLENGLLTIQNDCDAITDEDLKHLFDRFYTGANGNTGIGLSLAKEIIELHGGRIRAERTTDGIRFLVSF